MITKPRRLLPGQMPDVDGMNRLIDTAYFANYVTVDPPLCLAMDVAGVHFWVDMPSFSGDIGFPQPPGTVSIAPVAVPGGPPSVPPPPPQPGAPPAAPQWPPPGSPGNPPVNFPGGFSFGPVTTGTVGVTVVGPVVWYGSIDLQGPLTLTALPPPPPLTIAIPNPGSVTYSMTTTATTLTGLTTAPAPLTTTAIGPNSPPSTALPIFVTVTTSPGVTLYNIIQTTPTPGPLATVLYDPISVTATATTPLNVAIQGVTVNPNTVPPTITVPITSAPTQSLALPTGFDTTATVISPSFIGPAILVQQLPTPPAPTLVGTSVSGATNVTYQIVLSTPAGTFTLPSSSLSLTSIATPSTTNPVSLQANLTGVVPPGLLPGSTVILYRPTSGGGLATGPIAVGVVNPGTGIVTFTDYGQGLVPNLPTTAPATNTTGTANIPTLTGANVVQQADVATVTVTPTGTPGATSYTYRITATDATGETTGTTGSTTTGNATLSTSNPNAIAWTPSTTNPTGYNVYRTVGGATQGKIGSVLAGQPLVFLDTGLTGSGSAPASNTTGQLLIHGTSLTLPVTVPNGGTGTTSFTADAVICGGTTSTGALQTVSGLGTSGQVLTSNGAGALPTWQAAGGGGVTASDKTDNTGTSTSSTTYVDLGTLSFASLANGTYVFFGRVLASWSPGGSGLTASARITDGTTTIDESNPYYGIDFTPSGGTTYGTVTLFGSYTASGSPTVKIQVLVGGSTTITFTGKLSYIKIS